MGEKNKWRFSQEEIEKIVSTFRKSRALALPNIRSGTFSFENTGTIKEHDKFHGTTRTYRLLVRVNDRMNLPDLESLLKKVFGRILKELRQYDGDLVKLYFDKFPERPFSTATLNVNNLTVDMLFNVLSGHMQSNKSITLNGVWLTDVMISKIKGDGKKRQRQTKVKKLYRNLGKGVDERGGGDDDNVNGELKKYGRDFKLGVFNINYGGDLKKSCPNACFSVCVLVGLHYLRKTKGWELLTMRKKKIEEVLTEDEVLEFYEQIGKGRKSCVVLGSDFPIVYERYLKSKNIDLVVFSLLYDNTIVYDSRTDVNGQLTRLTNDVIGVWLNNEHYDLVLNFSKFIYGPGRTSVCVKCMKRKREGHICCVPNMCFLCYTFHDIVRDLSPSVVCALCNLYFTNQNCLINHYHNRCFEFDKKYTPCEFFKYCEKCGSIVQRKRFHRKGVHLHNCDKTFCNVCNKYAKKPHFCYMTTIQSSFDSKNIPSSTLFFFDFETKEDELTHRLTPYYCVVEKVCLKCENQEFETNELKNNVGCCGKRRYVFQGDGVLDDFLEFMFSQNNSVWIAHNGSRFDTVFILDWLMNKKGVTTPNVIMSGNKIMKLEYQSCHVLDSYLFFQMRLEKLPKCMGLGENVEKGYHPYRFTDINYVGEIVNKCYFDIERMNENERRKFDEWYSSWNGKLYVFKDELFRYCQMDVEILRKACVKFSQLIRESTNNAVYAFYDIRCMTIASLAMHIFRSCFLREKTIGVLPSLGYRCRINQSIIALIWLEKISKNKIHFFSKLHSCGEKKIGGDYVDGFDEDTNTIYQFHGCYYHGCLICYSPNVYNEKLSLQFGKLNHRTSKRTAHLRDLGYSVIEKWECDFIREQNLSREKIKLQKKKFFHVFPLEPRSGLFGGRTSPVILQKHCKKNEKIFYVDFTSLYPFVQKSFDYPLGHPNIYVGQECLDVNVLNVFGLVKCKVLPPKGLLFPVLPSQINGKLMFVLCRTCAELNQSSCDHKDEEDRCLRETWVSEELKKAIELGYIVKEIYEVYDYKKKGKIFQEYVNTFLKIKQESSGFPANCFDENGEIKESIVDEYISGYLDHEGIHLNREKIMKNEGMRTVAKTLLNSLWGKFAQNEGNTKVVFVKNYDELMEWVQDKRYELTTFDFVSEDSMRLCLHPQEPYITPLKNGNVVVACFVTSYSRLRLYEKLQKLQHRVLYFDTDSIIYYTNVNESDVDVECGNYLGELTNELDEGEWIESFCSTGPKCYSYVTNFGKTIVHAKGFSLKGEGKDKINFDSMKHTVEDKQNKIEINYTNVISRTKTQKIHTKNETKIFSFTFDKRIVNDDFTTLPFGYF